MAFIEITRVNDKYSVTIKEASEYTFVGEFDKVYINNQEVEDVNKLYITGDAIIRVDDDECNIFIRW